jgi:predicted esterase
MIMPSVSDPHSGQPVLRSGPSPKDARLVAILLHGRGASAEDILGLAHQFSARDIAYVAPQAAGSTWYPADLGQLLASVGIGMKGQLQ